jgi:hypothetical protein
MILIQCKALDFRGFRYFLGENIRQNLIFEKRKYGLNWSKCTVGVQKGTSGLYFIIFAQTGQQMPKTLIPLK